MGVGPGLCRLPRTPKSGSLQNPPSRHFGEHPEAALLHVHRLRLALQLTLLLPPQAPAKSTVALIMTIKNSYLFFLVGSQGTDDTPASFEPSAN
jgi:hypothetical protein